MKNATAYEKKIGKLLKSMLPRPHASGRDGCDPVTVLVESILQADASDKLAQRAMAALKEEFVDFNELRVAQTKEISECIGDDIPQARAKAEMILKVLNGIFTRQCAVSMEYMAKMTKRDLRRHLLELGLDTYSAACVVLYAFGGHAIPVDKSLVECLKMEGMVHPDSDFEDVQGFLERIISRKDAFAAHCMFRDYVAKLAKPLARKHKAEQEAREKAEQEIREKAEQEAEERAQKTVGRKKPVKKKASIEPQGNRPRRPSGSRQRRSPKKAAKKKNKNAT